MIELMIGVLIVLWHILCGAGWSFAIVYTEDVRLFKSDEMIYVLIGLGILYTLISFGVSLTWFFNMVLETP